MFGRPGRSVLATVCAGGLLVSIDGSIVNVALPSIGRDLGIRDNELVWVVNAYLLAFSGLTLVAGRIGDLLGFRRLFLIGLYLFTVASVVGGIATHAEMLMAARAAQGAGGAIVWVTSLSLALLLFQDEQERTKALSAFTFVNIGAGTLASLFGGVLVSLGTWRWVLLVNLPIGILLIVMSKRLLPGDTPKAARDGIDVAGAFAITGALILAVCSIQIWSESLREDLLWKWLLFASVSLVLLFVYLERRARHPILPSILFRYRNLWIGTLIEVLATAGIYVWSFVSTIYLQRVLHYTPLEVGLVFLPMNLLTGVVGLLAGTRIMNRFDTKIRVNVGILLAGLGVVLFVGEHVNTTFWGAPFLGSLLVGLGLGIASTPLTIETLREVPAAKSGIASGLVNTSSIMGASFGLALAVGLSVASIDPNAAMGGGGREAGFQYQIAFALCSAFLGVACLIGVTQLGRKRL